MSFRIKDKTINITLMSFITLIYSIGFIIAFLTDDTSKYDETMKNIILVIVGSFFNNGMNFFSQNQNQKGD